MRNLEDELYYDLDFQRRYCHTNLYRCVLPKSVNRLFDGSYIDVDPTFYDPEYSNITGVIRLAFQLNLDLVEAVFGTEIRVSNDSVYSKSVCTTFEYGFPLNGYSSGYTQIEAQENLLEDYLEDTVRSILQPLFENGVGDIRLSYYSERLERVFLFESVYRDIGLLAIGFMFMVVFIAFQTRSLLVSSLVLFGDVTSMLWTNIIYRYILMYDYFGFFHLIALFMIIGLSVAESFIFYDAWRETARYQFISLAHRLSFCHRRVSSNTSIISGATFAASAFSPFRVVGTFCVFSGIYVVLNFFSIYLFLPPGVIFYHKYFEVYRFLCFCPSKMFRKNYSQHVFNPNESESVLGVYSPQHSRVRSLRSDAYGSSVYQQKRSLHGSGRRGSFDSAGSSESTIIDIHEPGGITIPATILNAPGVDYRHRFKSASKPRDSEGSYDEPSFSFKSKSKSRRTSQLSHVSQMSRMSRMSRGSQASAGTSKMYSRQLGSQELPEVQENDNNSNVENQNNSNPTANPAIRRRSLSLGAIPSQIAPASNDVQLSPPPRVTPVTPVLQVPQVAVASGSNSNTGQKLRSSFAGGTAMKKIDSGNLMANPDSGLLERSPDRLSPGVPKKSKGKKKVLIHESSSHYMKHAKASSVINPIVSAFDFVLNFDDYDSKDHVRRIPRRNLLIRILLEEYYSLITHRIARWIILGLFTGMAAFFCYNIFLIRTNEENVRKFDHLSIHRIGHSRFV